MIYKEIIFLIWAILLRWVRHRSLMITQISTTILILVAILLSRNLLGPGVQVSKKSFRRYTPDIPFELQKRFKLIGITPQHDLFNLQLGALISGKLLYKIRVEHVPRHNMSSIYNIGKYLCILDTEYQIPNKNRTTINIRFPPGLRAYANPERNITVWKTFMLRQLFDQVTVYTASEYYEEGFLGVIDKIYRGWFYNLRYMRGISLSKYFRFHNDDLYTPLDMQAFPFILETRDVYFLKVVYYFSPLVMLLYMVTFLVFVRDFTTQRYLGIKYMYQIMGIGSETILLSWLISLVIIILVLSVLIVLFLKISLMYPVFPYSSISSLFVFFLLYGLAILSVTVLIAVLVDIPRVAVGVCGLYYVMTLIPLDITMKNTNPDFIQNHLIAFSFPNVAMGYGCFNIFYLEKYTRGLTYETMGEIVPLTNTSMDYYLICFACQFVFYLLFAIFLNMVNVHKHGPKRKWNFLFKREADEEYVPTKELPELENFENLTNQKVFIQVRKLELNILNKPIIQNINVDIYKYGVTCILGENGCGKTVFLRLLLSNLRASSGEIRINGIDIARGFSNCGVTIGYASQKFILTDELTIYEHLYLCGRLRGLSNAETKAEVEKYLDLFNLTPDRKKLIRVCSEGMKKKVQNILAFLGDPDIIILDHPSAYLDTASKGALWNLILDKRETTTFIVVLYSPDEVDLYGDRVLMMRDGTFVAGGTYEYLMELFSVDRVIDIQKEHENVDIQPITKLIQEIIPELKPRFNLGCHLQFIVPAEIDAPLKIVENELDRYKTELQISNFLIRDTKMTTAFMRAINMGRMVEEPTIVHFDNMKRYRGMDLTLIQIHGLFIKQYYYLRNSLFILVAKIWLPSILVLVCLLSYTQSLRFMPRIELEVILYPRTTIIVTCDMSTKALNRYNALKTYLTMTPGVVELIKVPDQSVSEYFTKAVKENPLQVHKILFGIDYKGDKDLIMYNKNLIHSSGIAMNIFYNSILKEITNKTFSITNWPLRVETYYQLISSFMAQSYFRRLATMIILGLGLLGGLFIVIYSVEHTSGFYHLQIACQVNRAWYWLTSFIWDYAFFLISITAMMIVVLISRHIYLRELEFVWTLYLALLIFGIPFLTGVYTASFYHAEAVELIHTIVTTIFTCTAVMFLEELSRERYRTNEAERPFLVEFLYVIHINDIINYFSKWFNLLTIITRLHRRSKVKSYCNFKKQDCYNLGADKSTYYIHKHFCDITIQQVNSICDKKDYTAGYFDYFYPGIGKLCAIFLLTALIDISRRWLYYQFLKFIDAWSKHGFSDPAIEAVEVAEEKDRIRNYKLILLKKPPLLIKNLTKYYGKQRVVNGICLELNDGQVVGLVGVNGSGTSTTFQMLTHQTSISNGGALLGGYSLFHEYDYACHKVAITTHLKTGYTLYDAEEVVETLSRSFRYQDCLDTMSPTICRGTMKLINNSIVSIGNCPVLFYNDPTEGLDFHNKLLVWTTLSYYKQNGRCIIFTSQDLKDLDLVPDEVAIMAKGNIIHKAPLRHLNEKFHSGFHLYIEVNVDATDTDIDKITDYVFEQFQAAYIKPSPIENTLYFYIESSNLTREEQESIMNNGMLFLPILTFRIKNANILSYFNHLYDII